MFISIRQPIFYNDKNKIPQNPIKKGGYSEVRFMLPPTAIDNKEIELFLITGDR